MVKERTVNDQDLENKLKQDVQMPKKKSAIHKRLSEQSKQKADNLTQKVQYLIYELEGIWEKANDRFYKLEYLLNVDAMKKETLENIVKKLENSVFDLEHDCAEAIEELAVSLVVHNLLSYFLILYLPNVWFNFTLTLTYKACQYAFHKKIEYGVGLQWDERMTQMLLEL